MATTLITTPNNLHPATSFLMTTITTTIITTGTIFCP
jgi:hypothetical protein